MALGDPGRCYWMDLIIRNKNIYGLGNCMHLIIRNNIINKEVV